MICILKRSIPVCHMKYTNNMYYIYVLNLSVTLSLRPASNVMESFGVPFFIFWQNPVLFTSQTSYGRLWHTEKYMWHSPSFNCTIHWSCRTLAYQYGCLFIIITQHSPFSMLKNFTVMKKAVRLYHLMMWTKFLKVSQVLNLVHLLIKQ